MALAMLAYAESQLAYTESQCQNGACALRLVDGINGNHGRLEIYYNGLWGTVCRHSFDYNDAFVACQELGLGSPSTSFYQYTPPGGSGQIWMDDLACTGAETRLAYCATGVRTGSHNCDHTEDVGLSCDGSSPSYAPAAYSPPSPSPPPPSTFSTQNVANVEGNLRLVDGTSASRGRLEVYHSSQWGTVCDDYFDRNDAIVACRQLGLDAPPTTYQYDATGGTGQIWMDNLQCTGSESSLSSCTFNGWGVENCGHYEDVGLICGSTSSSSLTPPPPPPPSLTPPPPSPSPPPPGTAVVGTSYTGQSVGEGNLRLVGSEDTPYRGRLEVYHSGQWGTVCDDYFDQNDARVACRQLGMSEPTSTYQYDATGGSGQIWMDDLEYARRTTRTQLGMRVLSPPRRVAPACRRCRGSESSLSSCTFNGWGQENCGHSEDVGLICGRGPSGPRPPSPPFRETFRVDGSSCRLSPSGECVYNQQYSNNERCTITTVRDVELEITQFESERTHDYLDLGGERYSGSSGVVGQRVSMRTGDTATWRTDGSVTREGFVLCEQGSTFVPPWELNIDTEAIAEWVWLFIVPISCFLFFLVTILMRCAMGSRRRTPPAATTNHNRVRVVNNLAASFRRKPPAAARGINASTVSAASTATASMASTPAVPVPVSVAVPMGLPAGGGGLPPMGMPIDTTGDGVPNAMGVDTTGDGRPDQLVPMQGGQQPTIQVVVNATPVMAEPVVGGYPGAPVVAAVVVPNAPYQTAGGAPPAYVTATAVPAYPGSYPSDNMVTATAVPAYPGSYPSDTSDMPRV